MHAPVGVTPAMDMPVVRRLRHVEPAGLAHWTLDRGLPIGIGLRPNPPPRSQRQRHLDISEHVFKLPIGTFDLCIGRLFTKHARQFDLPAPVVRNRVAVQVFPRPNARRPQEPAGLAAAEIDLVPDAAFAPLVKYAAEMGARTFLHLIAFL